MKQSIQKASQPVEQMVGIVHGRSKCRRLATTSLQRVPEIVLMTEEQGPVEAFLF